MNQVRVQLETASSMAGVVEVPDDWDVVVVPDGTRASATPPVGSFIGGGYQPGVVVRVEAEDAPDELPDSVVVLSDRTAPTPFGDLRTRMAITGGMEQPMVNLVITCRAHGLLVSVICSGTERQWAGLAKDYDEVAASLRFEATVEKVIPQ